MKPLNEEDLKVFQQELYDFVSKHIRADDKTSLYMVCGTMLKTCIELYASVLSDEQISSLLRNAEQSIPVLKERMDKYLKDLTFH